MNNKIIAGIKDFGNKSIMKAQKHSPEILLITGIIGVIGSDTSLSSNSRKGYPS